MEKENCTFQPSNMQLVTNRECDESTHGLSKKRSAKGSLKYKEAFCKMTSQSGNGYKGKSARKVKYFFNRKTKCSIK